MTTVAVTASPVLAPSDLPRSSASTVSITAAPTLAPSDLGATNTATVAITAAPTFTDQSFDTSNYPRPYLSRNYAVGLLPLQAFAPALLDVHNDVQLLNADKLAAVTLLALVRSAEVAFWPYKSYDVTFNVAEGGRVTYDVEFLVGDLRKTTYPVVFRVPTAARYPVEFNVRDTPREVVSYDRITFNIVTPALVTKVTKEVTFNIQQLKTLYDTTFNVTVPPISYPVTFRVSQGTRRVVFDTLFDVIEYWVPVTLPVKVLPAFPGNLPPSPNKHRLNARVYSGDTLVGAGVAAFLWTSGDSMRLYIQVLDIPRLSATMRVVIYRNNVKIIDEVVVYSPVWEGYFYGAA